MVTHKLQHNAVSVLRYSRYVHHILFPRRLPHLNRPSAHLRHLLRQQIRMLIFYGWDTVGQLYIIDTAVNRTRKVTELKHVRSRLMLIWILYHLNYYRRKENYATKACGFNKLLPVVFITKTFTVNNQPNCIMMR